MSKCFSRGFNWAHAGRLRKVQPVSMDLRGIQFSCMCCSSAVNSPAVLAHFNDILSETPGASPRPSSMDLISSYWLGWDWSRVFWKESTWWPYFSAESGLKQQNLELQRSLLFVSLCLSASHLLALFSLLSSPFSSVQPHIPDLIFKYTIYSL